MRLTNLEIGMLVAVIAIGSCVPAIFVLQSVRRADGFPCLGT